MLDVTTAGFPPLIVKYDAGNHYGNELGTYVKNGFLCYRNTKNVGPSLSFICFPVDHVDLSFTLTFLSMKIVDTFSFQPLGSIHICGDFDITPTRYG